MKVLDVNLRPPHDDRACVEHTLHLSDMLKLNDAELERLCDWFAITGDGRAKTARLARRFGLSAVCVTRGARGASLWRAGKLVEHGGFAVTVQDSVGAGDAFLAALLAKLLAGETPEVALEWANATGAFVATRRGATPPLDVQAIGEMARGSLRGCIR
jgi:fructokinase